MNYKYCVPHLEWEAVKFPLSLQNLKFEHPIFDLDVHATIMIWRQEDLQLKGKISGQLKSPLDGYDEQYIGKGNIIQQQVIKGSSLEGDNITLSGCVFGGYKTNNLLNSSEGFSVEIELVFDKAYINYSVAQAQVTSLIHYEWFLCGSALPHFYGTTSRSLLSAERKVRIGIDKYDDANL